METKTEGEINGDWDITVFRYYFYCMGDINALPYVVRRKFVSGKGGLK